MTEFSEHLKQIRKARGFTQKDVAAAIEITERNYQCYESGSKKPGFDSLIALADISLAIPMIRHGIDF